MLRRIIPKTNIIGSFKAINFPKHVRNFTNASDKNDEILNEIRKTNQKLDNVSNSLSILCLSGGITCGILFAK